MFQNKINVIISTPKKSLKKTSKKLLSATNLGKIKGKSFNEVVGTMTSKNYILDKTTITSDGKRAGLKYEQNSKGDKWIVYPESLTELL